MFRQTNFNAYEFNMNETVQLGKKYVVVFLYVATS